LLQDGLAFGLGRIAGTTAYFGLLEAGGLQKDDVVVVSGAAGAVGSYVGQIAKIKGNRVIGIAGGPEKCKVVKDLGFDEVIDYKNENVVKRLQELVPDGIDLYFDNVAGATLDAVFQNMKIGGRISQCGAIAGYNGQDDGAPKRYFTIITKRLRVQGFIVFDFMKKFGEGLGNLKKWDKEGKIKALEDVQTGFENIVPTFRRLFKGENIGKQLLKL